MRSANGAAPGDRMVCLCSLLLCILPGSGKVTETCAEILKYMEGQWARARSMKHIAEKVFPFGGEDELMLFGTVTVWTKEDGAEITVDYAGRVLLDRQNGALKIRGYYMHLVSLETIAFHG